MKLSLVMMLAAAASASALEDRTFWPINGGGGHGGGHGGEHGGGGYNNCPVSTSTVTQRYTETKTAPAKTIFSGSATITDCTTKVDGVLTKTIWGWVTEVTTTQTQTVPTTTITSYAPAKTTTSTCTETLKTCSKGQHYRRFQTYTAPAEVPAITTAPAIPEKRITNAERLRRGLPLAQPEKRHFGGGGHGGGQPQPGPSCLPSTTTVTSRECAATTYVTPTVTKPIATTSACTATKTRYTDIAFTTSYQKTITETCQTTTALNTITKHVTPTKTVETTTVKTIYTGKCGHY